MRKFYRQILNRKKIQTSGRTCLFAVLVLVSDCFTYWFTQTDSAQAAPSEAPTLQRFSLGQVLYLRHCADCHGWEGRGDGPLAVVLAAKPRNLQQRTELLRQNDDIQLATRILYGTPLTMLRSEVPYNETEVTALTTYLRQLPTLNWTEIERGKEVYDSLCAACHGLYGRGDGLGSRSLQDRVPNLAAQTYH